MARLIDADALKKKYTMVIKRTSPSAIMERPAILLEDVDEAPTIDAEPIRHGKWRKVDYQICVGKGTFVDALECSVCEEPNYEMSKYCPYCGAKMEVEE